MKTGIHRFFAYARERHSIYLRKRDGQPRPWTKDRILDHHRFCCVFREHDKTTAWFRRYARDPLRRKPEVMLATVVFRLLNRIETGEAIFCQGDIEYENAFAEYLHAGRVSALRRAVIAHVGKTGPYVTGAYTIVGKPDLPKLDGMLWVIDNFRRRSGWEEVAEELLHNPAPRLQDVWEWMREFPFLGNFHSYEIVTDLRHTRLLERATDVNTWASPGPGANRGLNRIHGRELKQRSSAATLQDEMREVLELSRDSVNNWPERADWPKWEMREVEHTLCEFDKYERVRLGQGRPRGVYR